MEERIFRQSLLNVGQFVLNELLSQHDSLDSICDCVLDAYQHGVLSAEHAKHILGAIYRDDPVVAKRRQQALSGRM